ncbi:restriction endonuclease subunit S [Pelosinus sp. sgz500959]|uniref:restriction endonuclease subunit S n=1 Tax=Pelosinus sp. sgz500959 TaxID=3242472 RepID=UPI00366ECA5E
MNITDTNALQSSVLGASPTDWHVDRIRDRLGAIVGGEWGDDLDAHDEGVEIAVIRVADIRGIDVAIDDLTIRRVKESKLPGRIIGERTVLLEKSGGGEKQAVGRAVLGRMIEFDAICSNFMAKTDCSPKDSPLFVAYLLDSAYNCGINTAHIQQTTGIQNLRVTDYLNTKFAFPSLSEQERIAAYLESSCVEIDRAIATKCLQLETLDALRKEAIQRAVTRGLDEHAELRQTGSIWMEKVPVGWDLICLKRVAKIQGGLTLGKVYDGPVIERPYLRVANVQDGYLALEDVTIIEVPLEVAKRVELRIDDVLMTEGGDLDKLGRGFLWSGEIPDCLHQNHIFAVRCFRHKLLPKFLTYLTASRYGRDYFEATGKKTTNLASTNSTKVGAFPLPLPSVEEQERIVAFLDTELEGIKSLVANIENQISTLTFYRKSLIHECVTGQQRVLEADVKLTHTRRDSITG